VTSTFTWQSPDRASATTRENLSSIWRKLARQVVANPPEMIAPDLEHCARKNDDEKFSFSSLGQASHAPGTHSLRLSAAHVFQRPR
jgi:hypothetical protein